MLKKISTLLNKIQDKIFEEKRFIFENKSQPKLTEKTAEGTKEKEIAQRRLEAQKQALSAETGLGLLSEEDEKTQTELNEKLNQLKSENLKAEEKQNLFNEITGNSDYASIANPSTTKNLLEFYSNAENKGENFTKLLNFIEKGSFEDNLSLTIIYCKNKNLNKEINTIFDAIKNNTINSNTIKFINTKALNILLKGRNTKELSLEIQTYLLNSKLNAKTKDKLFKKLIKETQNLNKNALKELLTYSQKDDTTFDTFIEKLDKKGRTTLLKTSFETTGAAGQEFKLTKTKIKFTTEAINPKNPKRPLISKRSFMRRDEIENAILKAKTPDEVIKVCYSHLLKIVEKTDYSKKVKNYETSNELMKEWITKLDEKNKTSVEEVPTEKISETEKTPEKKEKTVKAEETPKKETKTETIAAKDGESAAEKSDRLSYTRLSSYKEKPRDLEQNFTISSPEIRDLNKDEFINKFDNISGSELITIEMAKLHGIQAEKVPALLAQIIENGKINVTTISGDKNIEKKWGNKETYEKYLSAKKVIKTLTTASYKEKTKQNTESTDYFELNLIDRFKKHSKETTKDTTEYASWMIDAESKSVDPTLRGMDKQYYDVIGNVFGREISDEVAAIQILDQATVKIIDIEDATGNKTEKELKIYTLNEEGEKIYNQENVEKYLAHLIRLGQKQEKLEKIRVETGHDPKTILESGNKALTNKIKEKLKAINFETFKKEFDKSRDRYFELIEIKDPSFEIKRQIPGAKYEYESYKAIIDSAIIDLNLSKGDFEGEIRLFALANNEVALIKKGYLYERTSDELQAELEVPFSKNPKIREIQNRLLKDGYPASEIGKVESVMLAAGGLSFEGSKIQGGALAFPVIDLGNGYKIAPVVSTEGLDLAMGYQVYKSEDSSAKAVLGAGAGLLGPRVSVGYIQNISIDKAIKNVDFQWAFGVSLSATPGAALTIGFEYNEEKATLEIYEGQREHAGMTEIDRAKNSSEKVALLKKHPTFKELAKHLDEGQLLYAYETWKSIDADNARKGGEAPIISGIQGGFMVTPGGLSVVAAITFTIGTVQLVQPSIEAKYEIAKAAGNKTITEEILRQLNEEGRNRSSYEQNFYSESPDLYMTKDGNVGVLKKKSLKITKITNNLASNLEDLKEKLRKAELDIEITTIEIDGEMKEVLELKLLNTRNKDIELVVDPATRRDLGIILATDGRILIPGNTRSNLDGLIITSNEYNFRHKKIKGGAATVRVITISNTESFNKNNQEFNINDIRKGSKNMLTKKWMGDSHSQWEIVAGENTGGIERINPESRYKGKNPMLSWEYEDFQETMQLTDIDSAEYKDILADVAKMGENFNSTTREELKNQSSRMTTESANELYKNIEQNLLKDPDEGGLSIADTEGILKEANKNIDPPLNDKEAGEFLSYANNEYFTSIWKSGGKEKVKAAFDKHNDWISKTILVPQYTQKIIELGIDTGGKTAEQYATTLSAKVQEHAQKSFEDAIKGINNWEDIKTSNIPEDTIFASGTSIRATKEGVLTSMLHTVEMEGVAKMGIIGEAKEWKVNSTDPIERDLARITMATLNMSPNTKSLESLHQPITIELLNFTGTRLVLGDKHYERLTEFYSFDQEAQQDILNDSENQYIEAINEFAEFYKEVIYAINNKNGVIELETGTIIRIESKVSTGAYGQCGNLSSMLDIDFELISRREGEEPEKTIVASDSENVGMKKNKSQVGAKVVLGLAAKQKEKPSRTPRKPNKPPGRTPRKSGKSYRDDSSGTKADTYKGAPTARGNQNTSSAPASGDNASGTIGDTSTGAPK